MLNWYVGFRHYKSHYEDEQVKYTNMVTAYDSLAKANYYLSKEIAEKDTIIEIHEETISVLYKELERFDKKVKRRNIFIYTLSVIGAAEIIRTVFIH